MRTVPVILSCDRCGRSFSVSPSQSGRRYCSMVCFRAQQTEETQWVHRSCAHCGKGFRVRGKEDQVRPAAYCSAGCRRTAGARTSRACAQCGAAFFPKNPNVPGGPLRGLFCSKTCSGLAQRTRVARTCVQCGAGFEVKASRAAQGKGRYCGVDCQVLAEGSVYRLCQGCGKAFRVVRSVVERGWGAFCSQACTARRVERSCRVCGTGFSVKVSVADDGRGFYCSNACRHVGHRNRVELTCPCCSTRFTVPLSLQDKRRTCSRACWVKIMGTDPGRSAILAKARHDMLTTRAETRPERILYALIDAVAAELAPEVGWERQHRLLERWTVDAAVPSLFLVLQADGDYWHGLLPESRQDPRVAGNLENDARQDRALAEAGWTVLRFWESDLIGDLPECEARLRTAVAQRLSPEAPASKN